MCWAKQRTILGSDFAGVSVPENAQQLLVIHEILRNKDGTALLYSPRQLPKDAVPRLARQVVRVHSFPVEGVYRWVLLVEVVEELTGPVAEQLVDGCRDEPDNVRGALEALELG